MRRAFLLLLAMASAAHADTLAATLHQPLVETSHEVTISVEDGVATYRVQRTFANSGERADEASLDIDLPFGGGVTGLRIRSRDAWYTGDLMEASEAARLYEKLTGFGPFPAKDPALLQWVWPDKVHLQVFPVLPKKRSTVEYTITLPTQYRAGHYHLSYPRYAGRGMAAATFMAPAGTRVDGQAVGSRYELPKPAEASKWEGGVERMPGASYVFSPLEIADAARARGSIRAASLDLDLSHTYRGDLRVELVTPQGKTVLIHDRQGGSENDLRGSFPLILPPGTTAVGKWRLVISDHAARDVGTLNRWTLHFDLGHPLEARAEGPLFIPDAPEGEGDLGLVTIDLPAPPIDTVAARLGRVVASPQHGFSRLDVDAAAELRPLPKNAQVVFVIDASHSEGEPGIAWQLALARAYLGHVPDAQFEMVLFRRSAVRMVGGFAAASRFDEIVATARGQGRLAPGNGSALDLGLAAALEALRDRQGPRRVVVLSDAELRTSFSVARATPSGLGPDTVVHVVLPEVSDEAEERRDDQHMLSPIAAAGHGVFLRVAGPADAARLRSVVLGLVRPIRIDHFKVSGKHAAEQTFEEGKSIRSMIASTDPPARVTLEGQIWAEPFRRTVEVSERFSKATAAFVFSEHEYTALDAREQMAVAMKGQVVSPVTSYIAVEPGTRPSRIGLQRISGSGSGSGYGGGAGGLGKRIARGPLMRPDLHALVEPGLRRCLQQHPPAAAWSVTLDVETTHDEIVDVILKRGSEPAAQCAVEAAWAVRLPSVSNDFPRDRFSLTFSDR